MCCRVRSIFNWSNVSVCACDVLCQMMRVWFCMFHDFLTPYLPSKRYLTVCLLLAHIRIIFCVCANSEFWSFSTLLYSWELKFSKNISVVDLVLCADMFDRYSNYPASACLQLYLCIAVRISIFTGWGKLFFGNHSVFRWNKAVLPCVYRYSIDPASICVLLCADVCDRYSIDPASAYTQLYHNVAPQWIHLFMH